MRHHLWTVSPGTCAVGKRPPPRPQRQEALASSAARFDGVVAKRGRTAGGCEYVRLVFGSQRPEGGVIDADFLFLSGAAAGPIHGNYLWALHLLYGPQQAEGLIAHCLPLVGSYFLNVRNSACGYLCRHTLALPSCCAAQLHVLRQGTT